MKHLSTDQAKHLFTLVWEEDPGDCFCQTAEQLFNQKGGEFREETEDYVYNSKSYEELSDAFLDNQDLLDVAEESLLISASLEIYEEAHRYLNTLNGD